MKILIPLTILVLSFIVYYFFNTQSSSIKSDTTPVEVQSLTLEEKKEIPAHNYISHLATIKSVPTQPQTTFSDKAYLTLDDLRNAKAEAIPTVTNKDMSQKSYNQMIFQQLKTILQKASSTYYAKKHIALNSSISLILTSPNARERFKHSLAADFGLDDETINQELKHNHTVWDWVMFLSP